MKSGTFFKRKMKMNTSGIKERIVLGILISVVLLGSYSKPALGHFAITYYDNYNYDIGQWDAWQSIATPLDAWDDKYLADGLSGNTVFTDHAFTSISTFNLRGGLYSKDGHATGGEDWNPLQSIGDNESGQSAHHVFAAQFKGLIYLEEGDVFSVASDDDVYIFLDGDTAWGQEVLSIPYVSFFDTDSTTVTAAQEGYHTMTVKYIERRDVHSGIEITLNGEHLQNAEVPIDIKPGSYPNAINKNGKGVIPVAILGNESFDVTQIDPYSLSLQGLKVRIKGNDKPQCSIEDVSGDFTTPEGAPDGWPDLVCQFVDDPTTWVVGDSIATLTGQLLDGTPFVGTDTIKVVQ
jgi:hypothetical protein